MSITASLDPAEAHRARLATYVEPHLERRAWDKKHPVHAFASATTPSAQPSC